MTTLLTERDMARKQQEMVLRMEWGDERAGAVMQEVVQSAVTVTDFHQAMYAALATSAMRTFKRALWGWLHGRYGQGLSKVQARRVFREVWGDAPLPHGGDLLELSHRFSDVTGFLQRLGFIGR